MRNLQTMPQNEAERALFRLITWLTGKELSFSCRLEVMNGVLNESEEEKI